MTPSSRGYLLGFIGVAIFSLTLPLTRIAVAEIDPIFTSIGRTVLAAAAALPILLLTRQPRPALADLKQLALVAMGVVFGFPVLSAIAMQTAPASHGGVVLGALPLATAAMSTVFAGERPSPAFWGWSAAGTAAVVVFALRDGDGSLQAADLLLFAALIAAAVGYAVSGKLARTLGGWQVICWALVLALPITLPLALWYLPEKLGEISTAAWSCFLYLALMSQLIGFFAWNKGLAIGGVAKVGQVQLLQTFMTLGFAIHFNNEPLTWATVGFGAIVAACVWFGRKAKVTAQ